VCEGRSTHLLYKSTGAPIGKQAKAESGINDGLRLAPCEHLPERIIFGTQGIKPFRPLLYQT
jgi:hypothetical protein